MPEVLFCVKPIKLDLASFKVPKRLQALPRLLRVTLWSCVSVPSTAYGTFWASVFSGRVFGKCRPQKGRHKGSPEPVPGPCYAERQWLTISAVLFPLIWKGELHKSQWPPSFLSLTCWPLVSPSGTCFSGLERSTSTQGVFSPLISFLWIGSRIRNQPLGTAQLWMAFQRHLLPSLCSPSSHLCSLFPLFLLSASSLSPSAQMIKLAHGFHI